MINEDLLNSSIAEIEIQSRGIQNPCHCRILFLNKWNRDHLNMNINLKQKVIRKTITVSCWKIQVDATVTIHFYIFGTIGLFFSVRKKEVFIPLKSWYSTTSHIL